MSENYCFDLSGRPGEVMKDWFEALSGGKLNMKMLAEPTAAVRLPLRAHNLFDERMTPHGAPLNPSLVVHEGQLIVNVRVCGKANHKTHNFLAEALLVDASGFEAQTAYGFEDLRLFSWKGVLYAMAAVSTQGTAGSPRTSQALLRIENGKVISALQLASRRHEKNWMPCVDGDRLRFVYCTDPLIVLDFNERKGTAVPSPDQLPELESVLRGGTPLAPYEQGWISIVHQIHAEPGKLAHAVYAHRLAVFDRDLLSVKVSAPFYLHHLGIEFVSGLAFWQDRWRLSYGVADKEAWIAEVDAETIAGLVAAAADTPKWPRKPPAPPAAEPGKLVAAPSNPSWNPLTGVGW